MAVEINSRDPWFKIIEMLQQNWAYVCSEPSGGFKVYFVSDASGVFDELVFVTAAEAEAALRRNGFVRLAEDSQAQEFIAPPEPPFERHAHPNGPIYSSGRFWT